MVQNYGDLNVQDPRIECFRHVHTSTVYHQRIPELFQEIVVASIDHHRSANVERMQKATTKLAKRSIKYLSKMAQKVKSVKDGVVKGVDRGLVKGIEKMDGMESGQGGL